MSERLELALLGHPQVMRDDAPLVGWRYRKSLALLCYLALTEREHAREALSGLLWGETSEANAKGSLRKSLTELRRLVGPWLVIDRQAVGLNRDAIYWLDVKAFETGLGDPASTSDGGEERPERDVQRLHEAVALYRGDLLEGFYVHNAPAFEEWALAERARLRELVLEALHALARHYALTGAAGYTSAVDYTTRLLALEPWREEAHRGLMALHARAGRRGAALAQYETCQRVLAEELGVEPAAETTQLYEQIRDGELMSDQPPPVVRIPESKEALPLPPVLTVEEVPKAPEPLFFARKRELERLDAQLERMLGGRSQVVFIAGGPGRGKTALLRAFASRAMEALPDLLVAAGTCNAFSGVGDPYLPFREMLSTLTGDVTAALSRRHALRLWAATPLAAQTVLEHGPHLIDALVPGAALLARAAAADAAPGDGFLEQLKAWVVRQRGEQGHLQQSALFTQYTNVLRALSEAQPLLLLLDDLQWADAGSLSLLFHLGRRLGNARVLIAGAYRPEEVAITAPGEPHPLGELLAELQRHFGDVTLDLSQVDATEGLRFVLGLLDATPNRLSADFRRALHRHTEGHPLFTIELLRAMQERGDLVQNKAGLWVEGAALDWLTLPARVEAVIEKRLERLDPDLRDLLAVASVEGERFTAQVVAQVEGVPERQVLRALSSALGPGGHRLVRPADDTRVPGTERFLSRFQFAHALFQEYLYGRLSEGERRLLHGEVAAALEGLYGEHSEEIAVELAHHYDKAGRVEKAVVYALRAGEQARLIYANDEMLKHFNRVLSLLDGSQPNETRTEWRLAALKGLGQAHYGSGDFSGAEIYFRKAIDLAQEIGRSTQQVVRLYHWLAEVVLWLGRFDERIHIGEKGLGLLGDDTDSIEAALMNDAIAMGYSAKGETERFCQFAYRSANLLRRLPYVDELRTPYDHICIAFKYDKKIQEAAYWVELLEEKTQLHGDLRGFGQAKLSAGQLLARTGDFRGAMLPYQRALEVWIRIGDFIGVNLALGNIAEALLTLGDLQGIEKHASAGLEHASNMGVRWQVAIFHWLIGMVHLCRGAREQAREAIEKCARILLEIDSPVRGAALVLLGRAHLAEGNQQAGLRYFQSAISLMKPNSPPTPNMLEWRPLFTNALSGLEETYKDVTAFRAFCDQRQEELAGDARPVFTNWYLRPDQPRPDFRMRISDSVWGVGELNTPISEIQNGAWVWEDPFGDCTFELQNALEIHTANGRDLWHVNLSAPRLLLSAPKQESWAIQTVCTPSRDDRPAIGGLLLWQDQQNYLRLDRGRWGQHEISFQGCLANEDVIVGRGRLPLDGSGRVYFRLERVGDWVRALCSAEGESWYSAGSVRFPGQGALQVGLHGIGMIDRTVYPGAYPEGTAIRFESFHIWPGTG